MIKCPNPDCGFENVPGTQFCEGCSEELPQSGGSAVAAVAGDMVKCPACDNLNPSDNAVCEVCGSDLHPGGGAVAAAGQDDPFANAVAVPVPPPIPAAALAAAPPAVPDLPVADMTPAAPDAPAVAAVPDVAAPVVGDAAAAPVAPPLPDVAAVPVAPVAADTAAAAAPVAAAPVAPAASGLAPGTVKLTVEQGMSVGKQFVLGDLEMLVGREDTDEEIYPDLDLSDQDEGFVHRRHATLKFENGGLTVTHLGGANKTRLNNRPLPDNEAQPVNIGDKIAFGKVVLRVSAV